MLLFTLLVSCVVINGAPTLPNADNVREFVEAAADDVSNLAVAKATAVGFAGGVAYNAATAGADAALNLAVNTGNTAADAAASAGGAALNYVSNIDAMEIVNNTEEALRGKNEAIITGVFSAKRKAINAIKDITEQNAAAVHAFVDGTAEGLNTAIESTQEGIQLSKKVVSDIASQITVENAQIGVEAAQVAVADAFNTTIHVVEDSGAALVNALILAKQNLQEAAEEFDSKETISKTKVNFGAALSASVDEAGRIAETAGLFTAIDNIIHSLAKIPKKINSYLSEAKKSINQELENFDEPEKPEKPPKVPEDSYEEEPTKPGATLESYGILTIGKDDEKKTAREFTEEELLAMLKELEKKKKLTIADQV